MQSNPYVNCIASSQNWVSKGRIECIDRHFDVVSAVEFKELVL